MNARLSGAINEVNVDLGPHKIAKPSSHIIDAKVNAVANFDGAKSSIGKKIKKEAKYNDIDEQASRANAWNRWVAVRPHVHSGVVDDEEEVIYLIQSKYSICLSYSFLQIIHIFIIINY